ncbi:hypothetical protein ACKKBG_A35505 [Auxenochlorella protothecoides x Auxenochlorella symbiontica]
MLRHELELCPSHGHLWIQSFESLIPGWLFGRARWSVGKHCDAPVWSDGTWTQLFPPASLRLRSLDRSPHV